MSHTFRLKNRVVLSVTGPDAESFLMGLMTNTLSGMAPKDARYAALLTPQGKIICDAIFVRTQEGYLLDTPVQADEALLKRLKMFKLRADVDLSLREDLCVCAFAEPDAQLAYADPRAPDMPRRAIEPAGDYPDASEHAYHRARTMAGVPELGQDFGESEVFPADVNMDLLSGVDFQKGCFVGQEVVSRMKRRGTARRRTLTFHFDKGAPDRGAALSIGGAQIGEITSSEGEYALARVRIDRMVKAQEDADAFFLAADRTGELMKSDWLDEQIKAVCES